MTDIVIKSEEDRSRLIRHISKMDISKPKKISIVEVRSKRSDAQNRLLWMWNNEIQRHLSESFGQQASAEEWHEILVSKLWPSELHPVKLPDGTSYKVGRAKTRKFTIDQMSDYMLRLDVYCSESLGLLLPHPQDLMYAVYGEMTV